MIIPTSGYAAYAVLIQCEIDNAFIDHPATLEQVHSAGLRKGSTAADVKVRLIDAKRPTEVTLFDHEG